ncbi:MAG TPA: fasciclin domain-containing protein, partial [Acidimicrobiales bacterium]
PAATAASNNPALSTLVAAVKAAGLVDTLNGTGPFTVFAPTNDAFAKIDKAGDTITVNGQTAVVCGNVQTANATVQIIDTVLMPG